MISPSSSTRHVARLALPLLLVAFGGWFADTAAQDPPRKKLPKPEVEDPNPPKLKPIRDPDKPDPKTPSKAVPVVTDLAAAARQTKHLALQDFFQSLAYPHDIMTMRQSGEARTIEPVAPCIGDRPRFKETIRTRRLGRDWLRTGTLDISAIDITGIEPYERIAVARTERFLKEGFDRLPEQDLRHLSRVEMLRAAAQALTAVVGFHESARARGVRLGAGWEQVESELRQKLLTVELDYLNALVAIDDWETAAATAKRLAFSYRASQDHKQIAGPLLRMIDQAMKSGRDESMREVQRRLKQLEELFPDLKAAQGISDQLRHLAEKLFANAKKLEAEGKLTEAQRMLREAEGYYPRLPDLHDYRLRLEKRYPILRVGVRDLPVRMAPALAATDAERYAVELIFEGLVELTADPEAGQCYEPALAEGRPKLVPMGRQFQLARDAYWSADRRITAADVRGTVGLLKDPAWPGHRPSWAELIEDVQLGDPFQVSLHLRQGFLDPLSLMTFKILPPGVSRRDLDRFARQPAGSGPYQYRGQETSDGRTYARFVANPNYGSRARKLNLPHIREVHFVKSEDPARDFEKGRLHLLLDLPAKKVKELEAVKDVTVRPPLPNRRVWFLAINHRRPALQNQDLRRALGLAVPRKKMLDDFFRPEPGMEVHRALTGPYPAGSWANDPNVPSLDQLERGKFLLTAVKKRGPLPRRLTLKYPSDDPQAARAMTYLCTHLTNELEIEIVAEPLGPHALREAVEVTHTYDLAYYHYDYPSEAYWLWPLFDPSPRARAAGGGNYLGYANDAELEKWFRVAMSYRQFEKVQEYTRLIHGIVESKMLLIPLWQLDTFVALHRNLKPVGLDPLLIFPRVEHWRLERR